MGSHAEQVMTLLQEHFGKKPIVGVEIGTGPACVTQAILMLPNVVRLYTIDPYTHRPGEDFEAGNHDQYRHNYAMREALERLRPYRQRYILCVQTSDLSAEFVAEPVDFVWIDGHHEHGQVRRDIENYEPKIKPGGLIGGHDYGLGAQVELVIDTIYPEVTLGDDFTWWVLL